MISTISSLISTISEISSSISISLPSGEVKPEIEDKISIVTSVECISFLLLDLNKHMFSISNSMCCMFIFSNPRLSRIILTSWFAASFSIEFTTVSVFTSSRSLSCELSVSHSVSSVSSDSLPVSSLSESLSSDNCIFGDFFSVDIHIFTSPTSFTAVRASSEASSIVCSLVEHPFTSSLTSVIKENIILLFLST